MIITRAFYRESVRNVLAIALVLLVVFVFIGMSSLLAKAVRGDFADRVVLSLLGWQSLKQLDLLLPLAFYLGVLLTFGRWYRDSEMTVLAACGIGIDRLLRPLAILALIVATVVAVLAFLLTPMAGRQIEQVKRESVQRPEFGSLSPGTFAESAGTRRIFYVEHADPVTGRMRGVFVSDLARGKEAVIVARRGETVMDPESGDKLLRLDEGRIYDGAPGEATIRAMEFERYESRLKPRPASQAVTGAGERPTRELWDDRSRDAQAELHWRFAKPVLVVVLAFWALLLAHTDVRRGRMGNIFAAILVYFIYSNLLGFGQTLIRKGHVPGTLGLWWVHALMLTLVVWLMWRRLQGLSLFPLPQRNRPA